MFGSLLLLTVILMTLSSKSVEREITSALGCRNTDDVLIVEIQRDYSVLWPNGDTCTIEEAVHQLPTRLATHHEPVLAVKADKDILLSTLHPLLDAAKELGMQKVIIAATGQGPARIYRR
jgi:biopolymer transport protein ExbD